MAHYGQKRSVSFYEIRENDPLRSHKTSAAWSGLMHEKLRSDTVSR